MAKQRLKFRGLPLHYKIGHCKDKEIWEGAEKQRLDRLTEQRGDMKRRTADSKAERRLGGRIDGGSEDCRAKLQRCGLDMARM